MKKGVVGITTEQAESFAKLLIEAERPCVVAHPEDANAAHALLKSFAEHSMRRVELVLDPMVQLGRIYGMDKARLAPPPFVIAEPQEIKPEIKGLDYSFIIIEEAAYAKDAVPKETIAQQALRWFREYMI